MKNLYENLRNGFKEKNIHELKSNISQIFNNLLHSDFLEQNLRYHPLGFIYCRLHEFENKENIRLHIWNKFSDTLISSMNIHNHFYDVNSYVFKGKVINTLYAVIEGDEDISHYQYVGSYINSDKRILTKTNIGKKLIKMSCDIINFGELYRISKEEIHSGGTIGESITITYSENLGNPSPLIFGSLDSNSQYTFESQSIPINVVKYIKSQISDSTD